MIAKIHKSREGRIVLAVCDSDLAGKKFEDNELQLDLSCSFYKGEEMPESRILGLFKVVNIINLAGENAVQLAINARLIEKKNVKKIAGIPHVQIVIASN